MKLFLPLFLVSFLVSAQNSEDLKTEQDSVVYYLQKANGTKGFSYVKKAFYLAKKQPNDSLLKESAIKFGIKAYGRKDTSSLKESYLTLKRLYLKNTDSTSFAKYQHYKALKYRVQNRIDSAYYYYHQSKNTSILLKDSLAVGRRLLSIAYIQHDEGDFVGSQTSAIEGLRLVEPLQAIKYWGDFYNILGSASIELHQFDDARVQFKNALSIFSKSNNKGLKIKWNLILLNNIGYSYLLEKKPREALAFLNKALITDSIKTKYLSRYKRLIGNIAECEYLLGNKPKAFHLLDELVEIRKSTKDTYGLSLSYNGLAYYAELEKQPKKALEYALLGYQFAKEVNNKETLLSSLEKLVRLTNGTRSKKYYKEYIALQQEIIDRERAVKNQFAKIRYETDKKENENKELKLEVTQNQVLIEKEKRQKQFGWSLALVLVLSGGLSYMYFRSRQRKQLYQSQLEKSEAREHERQQIAKSLHDEVVGDIRLLHQKLQKEAKEDEIKELDRIRESVRNLSHQLSSVSFSEVSFKNQLIGLISEYMSPKFRVKIKGVQSIEFKKINDIIKRTLYLCIRESLQNTIKYARANSFEMIFSIDKNSINLILEDDGVGVQENFTKGIGLKNLQERIEELNGSFNVTSTSNGTQTTINIPLDEKTKNITSR